MSQIAVVVAARGGSKGLPRKNARSLAGIPLLQWTADAVRAAGIGDAACLLSTDDDEIAAIGRAAGLDVPFVRPAELASDEASVVPVVLHALDWLREVRDIDADLVLLLQPTSPFRPPAAIAAAISSMTEGVDSVVGVKVLHRALSVLYHADAAMNLEPVAAATTAEGTFRRQETGSLYTPNGAIYLVRTAVLREARTFFPRHSRGLAMDAIASLDIDDPTDWALAEAAARAGITWRGAMPE